MLISTACHKKCSTGQGGAAKERVNGLDSVRAFAALSVLFAHILGPVMPDLLKSTPLAYFVLGEKIDFGKYLFTGHPAVIAFFVVSGFCIHYPYVNGVLPVLPFWAARLTRIMIPAIIAIVFAKLAHLTSFNFWDGYILWSVVCELFYYALYPVFVIVSRFVSWKLQFYIAFVMSCILVVVLGSDQYGNAHVYGPFLNWLVALPSWLAGCVLAERVAAGQCPAAGNSVVLWRSSAALIASILCWLTLNTPVGYYLTMNAFSLVVFFWLGAEISAARRGEVAFFEGLGKWSFSIYLFHMVVFTFLGRIISWSWWWGERLLVLPVILLLCYLAYQIIEKPSHKYARSLFVKFRQRSGALLVKTI
jgi:peptidoglycan/LPS O-acetylase OafA/YrhL